MIEFSDKKPVIRLIASDKNWIEGDAVRQLHKTAELPGMLAAVGLPDLHPGKGSPVGAVFVSEGVFYPHLIGNDVGCGMGLWKTGLKRKKIKRDRWTDKLSGLETVWDGDQAEWLARDGISPTDADLGLGTIGGGNHFAELQVVEKVEDQEAFEALGLSKNYLVLLVHSGSRGIGDSLFRSHAAKYGAQGLQEDSEDALKYMAGHDHAVKWAASNRSLIAGRFLSALGADGERVVDVCHNIVTRQATDRTCWIHRKGAVPSDSGPVIIPGTRGTLTYLVAPHGDQEMNAYSLAHGAGRKWKRSDTKKRLSAKYKTQSLTHTKLGGRVICEDKELLYEEAPQAYKNIDIVVKDMLDAGLIRIISTFRPLITYKMRKRP
ncbi:RNA ligase RtcB family protein [Desulfobacterales bacterium HSG2]|nr:RNA ligase RtcB family protein [Desulfobacterales bacterium HSG2]